MVGKAGVRKSGARGRDLANAALDVVGLFEAAFAECRAAAQGGTASGIDGGKVRRAMARLKRLALAAGGKARG